MKLTLTLNDQTVIELVDANYTSKFSMLCETKEEIFYLWNKMTGQNLSRVEIKIGDQTIQVITGLNIDGMQVAYNSDQTYTVHFYYYGASYARNVDQEYIEAAKILLGEE